MSPRREKLPLPPVNPEMINFNGGLDQVTPAYQAKPGMLRSSQNWEIGENGGYRTVEGYEAFSGQPAPSDATYAVYAVTITGSVSVGDTITGVDSSATAVVLAVNTDELIITKVAVASFTGTEVLNVSGSPEATATAEPVDNGASTIELNAQYRNLAADEYRGDISPAVVDKEPRGLAMLNDVLYRFGDNAGGTAGVLHKQSVAGWVAVDLGYELDYTSGGVTEIVVGDLIEGLISGATATVTGITLETGSWSAGTAAGRIIFASQTGTFQAEGIEVASSGDIATIAADSDAITLATGGTYEIVKDNFSGQLTSAKLYGCDGINRGFEFDGTTYIPINTGSTLVAPEHVIVHKKHLLFSFKSSVQHSGLGLPYDFTIVSGAAELALGDDITAFETQPGADGNDRLAIFSRNSINIMYGDSSADWNIIKYRREVGAYTHTVQEVGNDTFFFDDRGIAKLSSTQQFGNFSHSTISELVQPLMVGKKARVVNSCIVRDKNQYRLFFNDGTAVYVTMHKNKMLGVMPVLFEDAVTSITSTEMNDGPEAIYFGTSDGHVHQMDSGTSFNGESIETFFFTHFNYSRGPRRLKKYHNIAIEAEGAGYAAFDFSYELGYATSLKSQPGQETQVLSFSGVYWDTFIWDSFTWDGLTLAPARHKLKGSAENISLVLKSNSDYYDPLLLSGAVLMSSNRRLLR